jgi:hypothetical protein
VELGGQNQDMSELYHSWIAFFLGLCLQPIIRLVKKGRLANPRQDFQLILRPEDKLAKRPPVGVNSCAESVHSNLVNSTLDSRGIST